MQFHPGTINGVVWKPLKKFHDSRGWLCELFRNDELPEGFVAAMTYASVTEAGIARGPHEHVAQSDYFAFFGPGNFKVFLWDNRTHSPSHGAFQAEVVGEDRPMALLIPPGVVHAYKNVSATAALVFNCPNQLYKGPGRKEPIDEIRHEDDPETPFRLV